MRTKTRLGFLLRSLLLSSLLIASSATPARASETGTEPIEVCYVVIHIHESPGVGWDGSIGGTVTVEPGEYHPHTNCIVIDPG